MPRAMRNMAISIRGTPAMISAKIIGPLTAKIKLFVPAPYTNSVISLTIYILAKRNWN